LLGIQFSALWRSVLSERHFALSVLARSSSLGARSAWHGRAQFSPFAVMATINFFDYGLQGGRISPEIRKVYVASQYFSEVNVLEPR
jgi:hypothetical protein